MPTNCSNERSLGSKCQLLNQLQMMTVNDDHRAVCTDIELCLMLTCLHHSYTSQNFDQWHRHVRHVCRDATHSGQKTGRTSRKNGTYGNPNPCIFCGTQQDIFYSNAIRYLIVMWHIFMNGRTVAANCWPGHICLLGLCSAPTSINSGQRCADMYPRIDILRISAILTYTDTLPRIFYGYALRLNVILFKLNFVYCIH